MPTKTRRKSLPRKGLTRPVRPEENPASTPKFAIPGKADRERAAANSQSAWEPLRRCCRMGGIIIGDTPHPAATAVSRRPRAHAERTAGHGAGNRLRGLAKAASAGNTSRSRRGVPRCYLVCRPRSGPVGSSLLLIGPPFCAAGKVRDGRSGTTAAIYHPRGAAARIFSTDETTRPKTAGNASEHGTGLRDGVHGSAGRFGGAVTGSAPS